MAKPRKNYVAICVDGEMVRFDWPNRAHEKPFNDTLFDSVAQAVKRFVNDARATKTDGTP